MRLVVFGPQGAGKGTQGRAIAEKLGVPDIATGDIFRWAISSESDLGNEVEEYVESGALVPDDLTIRVVSERLSEDDVAGGFLLDGFPRTLEQARALDALLARNGHGVDAALMLEVPEEVSVRRLAGRRVCVKCGANYHVDAPPKVDWECDACGGVVVRRSDDEEGKIRERLRLYHEQTEPLRTYYSDRGLLRTIDGVGTKSEVFGRIVAVL